MLVELALQPGGVDGNANQVFTWRKFYEFGQLETSVSAQTTAMLPVVMGTPERESVCTG